MKPRTQYYLGFGIVFAAATAYMFSLYPKPTTPDYVYELAPVFACGLLGLIVEWILWVRRPDLDYFKRRDIAKNMEVAWRALWRGRTAAVHWLAFLGSAVAWGATKWPDLQRTASWLTFIGVAAVLCAAAVGAGGMTLRSPRLAGKALLVISGLFLVLAVCAPMFRDNGSGWLTAGFHLSYFLIATAVLEASAGLIALRGAENATGPSPLYQPPHSASHRWLDDDKGNV
jgi:hypothetical protein